MSSKKRFISIKACFALLFYMIIPSIAIIFIIKSYPELSKERFYNMIKWILPTAVAIVTLAQCSLFFKKGQIKHYLLNIGFVVATLFWIYGLLGGNVIITNQWNEYNFSIHMTKYVTIIATVAIINIIYYTLELRYHRKKDNEIIEDTADGPSSKKEIPASV